MYGDVETEGTLTYGATVFDRRRHPDSQPNMDVAVDMDTAAVTDCILRGLDASGVSSVNSAVESRRALPISTVFADRLAARGRSTDRSAFPLR